MTLIIRLWIVDYTPLIFSRSGGGGFHMIGVARDEGPTRDLMSKYRMAGMRYKPASINLTALECPKEPP